MLSFDFVIVIPMKVDEQYTTKFVELQIFVKDYQFWFFTKCPSLAYTYMPYSTVWCVGPTTLMDLVRNTRHDFNIGLVLAAQVL